MQNNMMPSLEEHGTPAKHCSNQRPVLPPIVKQLPPIAKSPSSTNKQVNKRNGFEVTDEIGNIGKASEKEVTTKSIEDVENNIEITTQQLINDTLLKHPRKTPPPLPPWASSPSVFDSNRERTHQACPFMENRLTRDNRIEETFIQKEQGPASVRDIVQSLEKNSARSIRPSLPPRNILPNPPPMPKKRLIQNKEDVFQIKDVTKCPAETGSKRKDLPPIPAPRNYSKIRNSISISPNTKSKNSDTDENITEKREAVAIPDFPRAVTNKRNIVMNAATLDPRELESVTNNANDISQQKYTPELFSIMNGIRNSEKEYITELGNALGICNSLRRQNVPEKYTATLFEFFPEIKLFHETEFLVDLNQSETPKQFVLCFVKNFSRFNLYIQREWLFDSSFRDLDKPANAFDKYIVTQNKFEPFLKLTTQRLSDYENRLACFRNVCETSGDLDNRVAAEAALRVVENVLDQIEKVHQFKRLFGEESDKFKKCGQVILTEKFKISVNHGKNKCIMLVYLCENTIIFADTRIEPYQCFDILPIPLTYCRVLKHKNKFEVGIQGLRNFKLAAETKRTKDQWCNELKRILKNELYEHY